MKIKVLKNVHGIKGCNDIVFVGGKGNPNLNVIYIGGDIQDLNENMKIYKVYSLESTASKLFERYKKHNCPVHIYAIRPDIYKNLTFAIYNNFVDMIEEGNPIYKFDPLKGAANQFQSLITSCVKMLLEDKSLTVFPKIDIPLHLIGFSKGCTVLTQLLYDLSQVQDFKIYKLFTNILDMYWLDSGHNGNAELWPTSENILSNFLKNFNCRIHGFGTPFQLCRLNRERSFVEYEKFEKILRVINPKNQCGFLLKEENNTLETHFKVIDVFPLILDGIEL